MKKSMIILSMLVTAFFFLAGNANAQGCGGCKKTNCSMHLNASSTGSESNTAVKTITDSLKVQGLCGMCKTRIEKAAKTVSGVTSATWNSSTNMLVYATDGTVKKQDLSDAITAAGHDTELGTAPDKVYRKLPGCCKYRD